MNPLKICGLWSIKFEDCYEKGLGKLVGTLPCVHSLGNLALSFFHQKVESGYLFLQPAPPLSLALGQ